MDWSDILGIIMAMAVAIGLPLALRSRKKGGQNKSAELHQHLLEMGIEAYWGEKGSGEEKAKRSHSEKSVGVIEVKQRNIDWINIIGAASQYGTHYFLNYMIKTPKLAGKETTKKIWLKKKKGYPQGKIGWKGDNPLAQRLNFDYRLEDKLLPSNFKGGIVIFPEPKWGYTRIRTEYFLPSPDFFEAIDIIAGHIRSRYG
jgi:hypothetical protein